jgi:hypothetical protein
MSILGTISEDHGVIEEGINIIKVIHRGHSYIAERNRWLALFLVEGPHTDKALTVSLSKVSIT